MTTHEGFFSFCAITMYGTYTGASYFFPFGLAVCIIFKNSAALELGIFLPWKQKIFMQRTETKLLFYRKKKEHAKAFHCIRDFV